MQLQILKEAAQSNDKKKVEDIIFEIVPSEYRENSKGVA